MFLLWWLTPTSHFRVLKRFSQQWIVQHFQRTVSCLYTTTLHKIMARLWPAADGRWRHVQLSRCAWGWLHRGRRRLWHRWPVHWGDMWWHSDHWLISPQGLRCGENNCRELITKMYQGPGKQHMDGETFKRNRSTCFYLILILRIQQRGGGDFWRGRWLLLWS